MAFIPMEDVERAEKIRVTLTINKNHERAEELVRQAGERLANLILFQVGIDVKGDILHIVRDEVVPHPHLDLVRFTVSWAAESTHVTYAGGPASGRIEARKDPAEPIELVVSSQLNWLPTPEGEQAEVVERTVWYTRTGWDDALRAWVVEPQ